MILTLLIIFFLVSPKKIHLKAIHLIDYFELSKKAPFTYRKKTYFFFEYSLKSSKQTAQKRCPQSAFCNGSFKAKWQITHIDSVGSSSTKSKSCMLIGSNFETIFQRISWRAIATFITIFLEIIYGKTLILGRIIYNT